MPRNSSFPNSKISIMKSAQSSARTHYSKGPWSPLLLLFTLLFWFGAFLAILEDVQVVMLLRVTSALPFQKVLNLSLGPTFYKLLSSSLFFPVWHIWPSQRRWQCVSFFLWQTVFCSQNLVWSFFKVVSLYINGESIPLSPALNRSFILFPNGSLEWSPSRRSERFLHLHQALFMYALVPTGN